MSTLLSIALLLSPPALAAPDPTAPELPAAGQAGPATPGPAAPPSARLLVHEGALITLELAATSGWQPGEVVALYVAEQRPDPRTGELLDGLRYAGDARVVWVGPDLLQLQLAAPDQVLRQDSLAVLGEPRRSEPTPVFEPPRDPAPEPAVAPSEADQGEAAEVPPIAAGRPERSRARVNGPWRAHYEASQALHSAVDWADDGHQTGIGAASVAWAWVPERGPGRVDVRLEGVRGSRWVAADASSKKEGEAREPAVGYWLWTTVEGASVALAPELGLAIGVQESGPAGGLQLGLRSGLPHQGHVRLNFAVYGTMGHRTSLSGMIPVSDRVRLGPRVRVGTLPRHDPPMSVLPVEGGPAWKQQRADGTLRLTYDASSALSATLGGGLAAYDLVLADAGPVLDLGVELRW